MQDVIYVLGVHQEVPDGMASIEIHFNPMFSVDVLAALTHALDIWDHCMRLVVTACLIGYSSQTPPYGEYITAVQQACLYLEPHNAEELRAEIRGALRQSYKSSRNITKEEAQALSELKKDQSRVILTADKGIALVVMDRAEYNIKAQKLLVDGGTYKEIKSDPTNKLKTKLISLLKKMKAEEGINYQLYKKMYPKGAVAPNFYRLPKIHKRDIPLRPIVSSRGSINYEVAKDGLKKV